MLVFIRNIFHVLYWSNDLQNICWPVLWPAYWWRPWKVHLSCLLLGWKFRLPVVDFTLYKSNMWFTWLISNLFWGAKINTLNFNVFNSFWRWYYVLTTPYIYSQAQSQVSDWTQTGLPDYSPPHWQLTKLTTHGLPCTDSLGAAGPHTAPHASLTPEQGELRNWADGYF